MSRFFEDASIRRYKWKAVTFEMSRANRPSLGLSPPSSFPRHSPPSLSAVGVGTMRESVGPNRVRPRT